ncbi:DMT family transporter [Nocardioides cynanchi]|uniref:DMT family transporter n=1 Tax=Nocardioides cynanchi TaxID=2558918 RepID=UPI001244EA85|nr:SMR family transporter [Nocardioides cynanchi]
MTTWLLLGAAIVSEVTATLSLKRALDRPAFYVFVALGYLLAFVLLSLTLREGLGIGVAYGVWAALGVGLTALGSRVFFGEPITPVMVAGLALIVGGVLLVEIGSPH